MTSITALLPASLQDKAKAVVAVIGIVLSVLSVVCVHEAWLPAVIQAATALGVYGVPNAASPESVETDYAEDTSADVAGL